MVEANSSPYMTIWKSDRAGSSQMVVGFETPPFQKSGVSYHCGPAQRSITSEIGFMRVKRVACKRRISSIESWACKMQRFSKQ